MAQELLSTSTTELRELALVPGTGGGFRVEATGVQVWDRHADGGFPDVVELKRRARDQVAPERDLGHADRARS